jgi:hypothetical protein
MQHLLPHGQALWDLPVQLLVALHHSPAGINLVGGWVGGCTHLTQVFPLHASAFLQ